MGHETIDRLSFSTIPPQPADETKRIKRNCGDAFPARLPWIRHTYVYADRHVFLIIIVDYSRLRETRLGLPTTTSDSATTTVCTARKEQ